MAANKNTSILGCAVIACVVWAVLTSPACIKAPHTPLMVGTNVWPGYEPLYLARESGDLTPQDIRLVEYASATEVLRAYRNGSIQTVALTLDEVLLLAERTTDVSIILVLDVSDGADAIVARPSITNVKELRGKRVGLETTALGAYVLTRALQSVGMTNNDVQTVPLEIHEQERAFKEGVVDAVVTFEPTKTKLIHTGAIQIFDSTRIPGEIVDVLAVKKSISAAHKAQAEQMVRAWFKTLNVIQRDKDKAMQAMAARENVSAAEFQQSLRGLRFPDRNENLSMLGGPSPALLSTAKRMTETMLSNRLLERSPILNTLLDDWFVKESGR